MPILRRQLKKLGLAADSPPDAEVWRAFLERVESSYMEANQDRYTLERSLMMSSREMHEMHDELRRSEANFKVLVEHSPDAMFVLADGKMIYANPAMAQLLGYEGSADLIGKDPLDALVHPDDRESISDYHRRAEAGGPVPAIRVRWRTVDNRTIVVEAIGIGITFDNRSARLVVARDVTKRLRAEEERERAEKASRLSEDRYRTLFEGSPLPIILFDPETLHILAVNDRAIRAYGYSREEFLELRMTALKLPEELPELVDGMRDGYDDGVKRVGVRTHRKKDGTLMQMDITSHAVTLDGERAILAINTDVTENRRLEERLRQAQKMEAVGQLAGGIAHDFNNILAIIIADADLALTELGEGHPVSRDIKEIEAAALRAAALTRQLLTFSRRQPCQPQVLALNSAIIDLEKMLGRIIGEDVRLSTRLASQLGSIEADAGQVDQVLMNLVVNARDAMPSGGTLTIETRNVELDAAEAMDIGATAGRYVMLSVADTGAGMDAALRARIFEPFFTTKEVGRGTGLGLATVFGIVKQSGGGLSVSSELGHGATFRIYFPRIDEVIARSTAPAAAVARRGTETVLVVEDEDHVRLVVRRMLASCGYTVVEARNARAAFDALGAHGDDIQLVVTDVVMPDIDGRTMAAQIQQRNPNMKVLYMSGHTDHPAVKGVAPMRHFIQKPFTAQEMALAVRRAIEGHRTSSASLKAVRV